MVRNSDCVPSCQQHMYTVIILTDSPNGCNKMIQESHTRRLSLFGHKLAFRMPPILARCYSVIIGMCSLLVGVLEEVIADLSLHHHLHPVLEVTHDEPVDDAPDADDVVHEPRHRLGEQVSQLVAQVQLVRAALQTEYMSTVLTSLEYSGVNRDQDTRSIKSSSYSFC